MKIRTGFVSNSSSCSFCIAKCYMTNEQIEAFSDWLSKMRDVVEIPGTNVKPLYETYINEYDYYFIGEMSQHESQVREFLERIGVDPKYIVVDY